MPFNALAPEPRNGLLTTARQYISDALPGSALNPEWNPKWVETAKLGLSFTPVIGDALSAYDAIQELRQGNWGKAALAGIGVLPFVPGITNVKGLITADRLASERKYYGVYDNTSKGILTMMPPQRFLDLSVEGHDVIKRAEQMKKFNVDKYNKESLPYLTLDKTKGQIVEHEGRARAMRALMDKVPEIPVVISSRGDRFKSIDELPSIVRRERTGEFVPLRDVVPVELLLRPPK